MADRAGSIQHVNINVAAVGTNPLVAGQAGMVVVVINYVMVPQGAVAITLEDADGTDRVGPATLLANVPLVSPDSNVGWCRTASGQGLNIFLGANVQVGGSLSYRMVPDHMEF